MQPEANAILCQQSTALNEFIQILFVLRAYYMTYSIQVSVTKTKRKVKVRIHKISHSLRFLHSLSDVRNISIISMQKWLTAS